MRWPTFQTLQLEGDGGVTWLRFNRPARLNALTEESFAELAAALRTLRADAETRVLVLTGNGRGFCSGSDVQELHKRIDWAAHRQLERLQLLGREVVLGLYELPVPTVAAINGPASGGGLSVALACDMRLASADATIVCGYTAMGLMPDLGATYFLPRIVGRSRACRLLWTNEHLTASQALAIGLVDDVLPATELRAGVAGLASRIAAAPQLAVRLGRAALRSASHGSLAAALEGEAAAQSLCLQSADHRDSVRAFLEQRNARKNATSHHG
ncbi:MAG: enoyl-CoA hydratase/isomerase family protein [Candidatus Binatia bacterium]